MPLPSQEQVTQAFSDWHPTFYPRQKNLAQAITVEHRPNSAIKITLSLGYPIAVVGRQIETEVELFVRRNFSGLDQVEVEVKGRTRAHAVQRHLTVTERVSNVIAVGSGKGGVGKSTVAVNLALAMHQEGARVGLLDADIYGPSQPTMLGLNQSPVGQDGKSMVPLKAYGLQVISVGFLVDEEKPIVWRGPMVSSAVKQLFGDCLWDDLDYLVIDLPPGTGDIQLTLAQHIPVTGALVVSTPQTVATLDARKSVAMFEKVAIPVLGLVENMAEFHCPSCGHRTTIFGQGGVEQLARDRGLDLLASIPLHPSIRASGDQGKPGIIAEPNSAASQSFVGLARQVMIAVAGRPLDYSRKFGRIEVDPSAGT